jgi:hypothetical protein
VRVFREEMTTTFTNKNIYIPLKPLFIIARIFGLADTQFFNRNNNEECKIRSQHLILAFSWNTIFLIGICYSVYLVSYNYYGYPDKVNTTVIVYYITLLATNIVTSISSSINRKKIAGILQNLMDIDELFKDKDTAELCTKMKHEVLRQIAALLLGTMIVITLGYYCYSDGTFIYSLCYSLEFLICNLNVVMLLLYINIIRVIRHRYKNIFQLIEEYVKTKGTPVATNTNRFIVLHGGCCEMLNLRCSSLQLLSNRSNHVQTLRLLYIEMYDTVQLIASHFGAPVLFQTLLVIVLSVLLFYGAFYFIYSADANNDGIKKYVISCYLIFRGILYITPFIWLVISCDAAAHEANRGVIYIQRVKASPNTGHDAVMELEKLSSQLKDRKVEFSVCGLVVLKLQFLCTFVGGIFTYILIMVQLN